MQRRITPPVEDEGLDFVMVAHIPIPELGIDIGDRIITNPRKGWLSVIYDLPHSTQGLVLWALEHGELEMCHRPDGALPTSAELRTAWGWDRLRRRPRARGALKLLRSGKQAQGSAKRRRGAPSGDAA